MSHNNRVIVLVDMDCFYCQVEENLNPNLAGKPIAVVQYNQWKGGGIIAVNYPARDKGVTRHMRGAEAKKKCPEIQLVSVPCLREKADLTKYRDAGKRVADVLQTFTPLLERASVDEAYLDITEAVEKRLQLQYIPNIKELPNTHIAGFDKNDFIENVKHNLDEADLKLCIGGVITEEIRDAVYKKTGYKCSAGIAHNKILAKLSAGLHKPNQQTILPQCGVEELYKNLPLRKIKSLGGKFGEILSEDLGISTMGELKRFNEKELVQRYDEKTGSWLYNIARGIDTEPVTVRLVSKSIGCCKKFPGRTALTTFDDVSHWINELSEELAERLAADTQENNRKAKQLVISFAKEINKKDVHSSRTHPLNSYDSEKIASDTLNIINKNCMHDDGSYCIKFMGISAGKFEDNKKTFDLTKFFNKNNNLNNKELSTSSGSISKRANSLLDFVTKENNKTVLNLEGNSLTIKSDFKSDLIGKENEEINEINDDDRIFLNNTPIIEMDRSKLAFDRNCTTPNDVLKDFTTNTKHLNTSNDSITEEINNDDRIFLNKTPIIEMDGSKLVFDRNCTTPNDDDVLKEFKANNTNINTSNDSIIEEINDDNRIFLNKTPIIEIDRSKLVFNRNYTTPDDDLKEFMTNNKILNASEDSITEEITPRKDVSQKQSYFSNFFNNITTPSSSQERNFDTSKNLEESFIEITQTQENYSNNDNDLGVLPMDINIDRESPILTDRANQSLFNDPQKDKKHKTTQLCSECNKQIPLAEIQSHLDYHFAIKIVKDEAHLYKENKSNNTVQKTLPTKPEKKTDKKNQNKGNKRKPESHCNKLALFLASANQEIEGPTEICPECNKKVASAGFVDHLDYHAAKKLHNELNSITPKVNNVKITGNKNKNRGAITSFLKRNS